MVPRHVPRFGVVAVKAIFVLGSPRSGTSVLGAYIGSHPDITPLGEYLGFHFAGRVAPDLFPHDLQRYQHRYLGELVDHSVDFVARTVASAGTRGFCDDSPWNMEIVPHLESLYPSALYLLCLRHYRGVIQSLRRSYADGRAWVGATDTDRAETWVRFYSNVAYLPDDRTLPVSFEEFCVEPAVVIGRIGDWLDQHSFDKKLLDPAVFVTSHAAGRSASRPTVASLSGSGRVTFGKRPGYDPTTWTADDERAARSVVLDVDVELRARFPRHYLEPRCTTTGKPDLIQAKE